MLLGLLDPHNERGGESSTVERQIVDRQEKAVKQQAIATARTSRQTPQEED
jgi:hypothetical protein